MIEARPLVAAEKFELLELLYRRLPCGSRIKPSTKALIYLFADCQRALHWSNARIAETLGYSMRTIARAMTELRSLGIISSVRKRRQTSQRYLWLEKAREIRSTAVGLIKQNCAIAVALYRRGLEVPSRAQTNHLEVLIGAKGDKIPVPPDLLPWQREWLEKQIADGLL